ncbi:hypothetical protein AYX15_06211 [Cryptococcus neoformans]|nr:hypothetical protein AYX15_06211 [Cryptococcus neoformans var. grubii]
MPGQFVNHLAIVNLPDSDCPIPSAHRDFCTGIMLRPRASNQCLVEAGGRAGERAMDSHGVRGEGTDVVDEKGGVERVGGEEGVEDALGAEVPYL